MRIPRLFTRIGLASLFVVVLVESESWSAEIDLAGTDWEQGAGFSRITDDDAVLTLEELSRKQAAYIAALVGLKGRFKLASSYIVPNLMIRGLQSRDKGDSSASGGEREYQANAIADTSREVLVGPFRCHRKEEGHFAWDSAGRRVISVVDVLEPINCENLQTKDSFSFVDEFAFANILVSPEGIHTLKQLIKAESSAAVQASARPGNQNDGTRLLRVAALDEYSRIRNYSELFDASVMLEIGGKRIDEWSRLCVRALKEIKPEAAEFGGQIRIYESSESTRFVVERRSRVGKIGTRRLVRVLFDRSRSGMPISRVVLENGENETERNEWVYAPNEGDALIPVEFSVTKKKEGEISLSRRVELSEVVINPVFNEADFSREALGVRDGDAIHDEIKQEWFKVANGRPEKLDAPPSATVTAKQVPRRWIQQWILLADVLAVCVVLIVAFRRRP